MSAIVSFIYNWIFPTKATIDEYDSYISLITKCIECNNNVILSKIFTTEEFLVYKPRLLCSPQKEFLIKYASNPTIDPVILKIIMDFFN